MYKSISLTLIAFVIICGQLTFCSTSRELDPVSLVNWVDNEENGLVVSGEIDPFRFSLQYQPTDYLIVKKLKSKVISKEEAEAERVNYEGFQYFTFSIEGLNTNGDILKQISSDNQEYNDKLDYLAFKIQDDLFLLDGQDTIPCGIHHFERTYGLSSVKTIVLGFEDRNPNPLPRTKSLIYLDQILGVGPISLTIPDDHLKNIPKLKST